MPELPEVETVRRGLLPVMEGRRIEALILRRPDLRWPFPDGMAERVAGARVETLSRRSKYLLANLDTAETILLHLGMSGRLLIGGSVIGTHHHALPVPGKHDHVIFEMAGGGRIVLNDARRFGAMDLWPTADLPGHRLLARLGPEPLGNAFNAAWLAERMRGRRSPVKAVLLDQSTVAGLGNIYACEALWRAGISPHEQAGTLGEERIAGLTASVRDVLRDAIAAGGSSLRDYRRADGELGYFQHSFAVYGRGGEPCRREGCSGVITRTVQSARSSFHCPVCQRQG